MFAATRSGEERKRPRRRSRRIPPPPRSPCSCLEPLEPRQLLAADLIISEFLAVNGSSITDEDGDPSHWIEIHNHGDAAADLNGWRLTDDAGDPARWSFPAGVSLQPGEFLLVFASGKNRSTAGEPLHASFTLNQAGGYLALLDGAGDVVHEYAAYPRQFTDVSYGVGFPPPVETTTTVLKPVRDTWLRQSDPSQSYENDAMWVAATAAVGEQRWGVAEWDLSGVEAIAGASMRFAPRTRADAGAVQTASMIAPGIAGLTWNVYQATKLATESPLDSLGHFTVPGGGLPFNLYANGASASVDDVAALNAIRAADGRFAVVFKATQGAMEWNDGANEGGPGFAADLPIELLLEHTPPGLPPNIDPDDHRYFITVTAGEANLGGRTNLSDGVFISEFAAINTGELLDEDGQESDWIELYNAAAAPVDLGGWHLTDDATTPAKWTFPPDTILQPGAFLIVFASDKDRATTGQQLHTNFRLTSAGEFLGLFDDTGVVRHAFDPFGEQVSGATYGLQFERPGGPDETPAPAAPATLYRVDFDDQAGLNRYIGNDPLAVEASFRFDDPTGQWSNSAVPHHISGGGGVSGFNRALLDSTGANPITFTHLAGENVRANNPNLPDALHGDFWFFGKNGFVDWQLTGLIPDAEYELFHYGGWPRETFDDERITIVIDTDGDGTVETSKTAGLVSGGPHGVHFASIVTDGSGRIRGRWQGVPEAPSWADTAGFQLALVTGVDPPPAVPQPLDPADAGYFTTPTPGKPNFDAALLGFVADTAFSHDRGFYQSGQPFDLVITVDTPDAVIYYTTDGTIPSPDNPAATVFDPISPPHIDRTTILRAAAHKQRFAPSNVDTQTYLFLDDVLLQSPAGQAPTGFPASPVNGQVFDYGMDPNIVNHPTWGPQMIAAMTAIASVSIVTDPANLFDPASGIYVNAGGQSRAWERPTSVELIHPDGADGFQIDAGIRPRGNFSASGSNPLHSFRLFFRDDYGGELNYPLFGDEGADRFAKLDLITPQNDGWAWQNSDEMTFIHDVYARDLQRDMGQPYTRSRYYHLYLNGQYWGLFQSQERSDANYGQTYFGADEDDFDVIKSTGGPAYATEATDGTLDAWRQLWDLAEAGVADNADYFALQGRMPDGVTRDPALPVLLDVDNLIDYMIGVFYTGDEDRPLSRPLSNNRSNNWFAVRDRTGERGFAFFAHDAEQSLESLHNVEGLNADRVGPFTGSNRHNFLYSNPQWLHQDLMANAEYRLRFADRVHRYFFNDGLLTPDRVIEAFESRADEIDLAIIAHSARWGDAQQEPPRTKDTWLAALDALYTQYMPYRSDIVLDQLRHAQAESPTGLVPAPLYPALPAPVFNQHGGEVAAGFELTITQPDNVSYIDSVLIDQGHAVRAFVPTSDALGLTWTLPGFDNYTGWTDGSTAIGVGYDQAPTAPNGEDYRPLIETDVVAQMAGQQSSVFLRLEFTLAGDENFDELLLRMKYDDGFVAYLDGVEVARSASAGAGALAYNATAANREDDLAIAFEDYDISSALPSLTPGVHVLAIHGLNQAITSSDMLILPQLVGRTIDDEPPSATIWFTLDGSDPRLIGGAINPDAIQYTGPVILPASTLAKARVFDGGAWSALNEALFSIESPIRISEIHYHPAGDGESEFVELTNLGPVAIDLTGYRFELDANNGDGIRYAFEPTDAHRILQPGGFLVITRDLAAFAAAYPGVPADNIADRPYEGALSNGGETLTLLDAAGGVLHQFAYGDAAPWPALADGQGPSLDRADFAASPDQWTDPAGWRPSGIDGGTPGRADPRDAAIPGDANYDQAVNITDLSLLATQFGLDGSTDPAVDVRWKHGDFNGDRRVNISDLSILATRFGQSQPAAAPFPGQGESAENEPIDLLAGRAETPRPRIVFHHPAAPSRPPLAAPAWRHIADLLNPA